MRIEFFETLSGRRPVADYIRSLTADRRTEVLSALADLEKHGLDGSSVSMRHIEGKLWELKFAIDRVLYVVLTGPSMVLLHAYKKQGQRAPVGELDTARRRLRALTSG